MSADGIFALHAVGGTSSPKVFEADPLRRRSLLPGGSANEVETADHHPITFASREPYTLALLIRWTRISGTQGIFRSGSASSGNWLWMSSSGRLWGRHANVDSPGSRSGPTITAGWYTLVRVWDGQQVRQYMDGLRTNTVAVTPTGSWSI